MTGFPSRRYSEAKMAVRMRIVCFWLDGSSLPCIVSGAR